jgi:2-dehydro-3-deoxyphosphogluconate aldolase / (4S)-4-hydroxy-2-oxoglutarate aldolase
MNMSEFNKLPIMGILRGVSIDEIGPILEAVIPAGLKAIEITMNTQDAAKVIKKAVSVSSGRISVGAGTVLSMDDLDVALEAGAEFIVMPVCVKEIMEFCVQKGIPVFPGAFTPNEVFEAWNLRASMVKVFPAGRFGPTYMKDIKGPLDDVKLMAVGGVKEENIVDFFEAGADAVAFGASVFKKEWLDTKNFAAIQDLVAKYVKKVRDRNV